MKFFILATLLSLLLPGCISKTEFRNFDTIDRIVIYEVGTPTKIREINHKWMIEEIIEYIQASPNEWRPALHTLPSNRYTLIFHKGTTEKRRLLIGSSYMSDGMHIKHLSAEQFNDFYSRFIFSAF